MQAAFPDQAERTLQTLLAEHPQTKPDIAEAGVICRAIIAVSDISRSLTNAIRRDPALLDGLKPQDTLEVARDRDDYLALLAQDLSDNPELDLRVWKRRELLRIVVRDALLEADLLAITGEISALANACLSHCLEVACRDHPGFPIAIVGMGKLGGNELNYASDVDVVFVHGDAPAADQPTDIAHKIARSVISQMSQHTADGVIFKVDTDLRPEGTSGAISRTPQGFKSYFEQRARPWERQAWMKACYVAGDRDLVTQVLDDVREFVWRPDLDPEEIRYIRNLKTNVEQSVTASAGRDFKRGPGGIRDIEFSTQLLLLAHGRSDPLVRSPNTLLALEQLKRAGSIDVSDAEHLSVAYRYLRQIEHRLQLRDEQAIYEIPSDDVGLDWLARVLGYRDGGRDETGATATAAQLFTQQYQRHQASVREIEQRLFLRPSIEALAQAQAQAATHVPVHAQTPSSPAAPGLTQDLTRQLELLGFSNIDQATRICEKLTAGISRTARSLSQMLPLLLSCLAATPDPDLGIIRFDWVTDGPHRLNTIIPTLRDSPTCVQRLCQLLGSSRVVADDLRRVPGFVRVLAEAEGDGGAGRGGDEGAGAGDMARTPESLLAEAQADIGLRGAEKEVRRDEVRRFLRRERLRVASRDLLELADTNQICRELTEIAEALSEAVLGVLEPAGRFCVLGMGSVGGQEMLYTSDLDVLFLHDGGTGAQQTAQAWLNEMATLTPEGRAWEVDVRLRPEGQGNLAHTIDAYQKYWRERARLWEFQSLLKVRVIAGDRELGEQFVGAAAEAVFAQREPQDVARELWDMRRRIREELGQGARDVKRGPGGRVDVAFAVQLLQLIYGAKHSQVRVANTFAGLAELGQAGVLSDEEAEVLQEAYVWCSKATNRHFLLTGVETAGLLSDDAAEVTMLARLMEGEQELDPHEQFEAKRHHLMTSAEAAVKDIFARHGAEV